MREIQTFILRLLVNTDEPKAVRGILHVVADGEEYPFTDGQLLLNLLERLSHAPDESCPEQDAGEHHG